jgi:hypothetical protein
VTVKVGGKEIKVKGKEYTRIDFSIVKAGLLLSLNSTRKNFMDLLKSKLRLGRMVSNVTLLYPTLFL